MMLWFGFCVLIFGPGALAKSLPTIRIVNGVNATFAEAPYAVSVRYNNCHECGGSIIGDRWILTAAHCVFSDFVNISSILYGTTDIQNCLAPSNHTKNVKKAYVNTEYEPFGGYFNDIAILELEDAIEFDEKVKPVKLPEQDAASPLDEGLLVGWGYPYANGTVAETLQKVSIHIYSDDVCTSFFTSNFSDISHICAGGQGKGQCTGDSGGALTVGGVQYGVVSWSDRPCASTPGVLTRVASFRDWIANIVGF